MRTHYIFVLWFLLSSSFFPRLISAIADWISTIFPHMVWPWCKFRMQVWNVLHAACLKYKTRKIAKISPSWHHRTTLSSYIFATKAYIENRKKNVKQQYLFHMLLQYGARWPTNGWERFGSLEHPSKFQRVLRLGFAAAATSLTAGQPNFCTMFGVCYTNTVSQKIASHYNI